MEKKSLQFKAGFIVLIVFFVGFLAGIGASISFMFINGPGFSLNSYGQRFGRHSPEPPFGSPERMLKMMTGKLDLNMQQQEKVKEIVIRTKTELFQLRKDIDPKMKEIIDKTIQDITVILSDEQKKEFEKISNKFRKRAERMKQKFNRDMRPKGRKMFQ